MTSIIYGSGGMGGHGSMGGRNMGNGDMNGNEMGGQGGNMRGGPQMRQNEKHNCSDEQLCFPFSLKLNVCDLSICR